MRSILLLDCILPRPSLHLLSELVYHSLTIVTAIWTSVIAAHAASTARLHRLVVVITARRNSALRTPPPRAGTPVFVPLLGNLYAVPPEALRCPISIPDEQQLPENALFSTPPDLPDIRCPRLCRWTIIHYASTSQCP